MEKKSREKNTYSFSLCRHCDETSSWLLVGHANIITKNRHMAENPFNGIRHTCCMVGGIPIIETRLRYNITWFQDKQCRL